MRHVGFVFPVSKSKAVRAASMAFCLAYVITEDSVFRLLNGVSLLAVASSIIWSSGGVKRSELVLDREERGDGESSSWTA